MSQGGKFIPGGAGRKTTAAEKLRTGPIRAPDGSSPAPEPARKGNRLFQRGAVTKNQVPRNRRLPILIMSGVVCLLLVSFAWYEVGVLPAQREAEAEHQKELLAQKQLADNLAAQKAAQDAEIAKEKNARATVTVTSTPDGTAMIGEERKPTPATFDDVVPGKITVTVQAPGYEDYHQDLNVTADKPTDLGTIQLSPQVGNLSFSSPQTDVSYTLTGPNGYAHEGTFPDKLSGLAVGDYQLIARQHDWQLPPIPITISDRDDLQKVITFPFATLSIESVPAGATVRNGNVILGQTPLSVPQMRPGTMNISVDLPPFVIQKFPLSLLPSAHIDRQVVLPQGRDFIAACGMPMVAMPDGYWVGKYDVDQRTFELVAGYNPSTFRRPSRPVETVSWEQAMAFCDKLNAEERRAGRLPAGFHYTLPTESQWDAFSADASLDLAATSRNGALSSTQDVGASEPNKYGLYDTVGNVWEWCLDAYDDKGDHSLRGGSWLSSSDDFPSAETRNGAAAKYADRFTGFRVVLVPDK
jgi:hypothetical protein